MENYFGWEVSRSLKENAIKCFVLSQAKLKWGNMRFGELMTRQIRICLLKFKEASDCNEVLSKGSWTIP